MAYEQYKEAISKGQSRSAPTSSIPELAAMFSSRFQLGESGAPTAGLAATANIDDANARAAAANAARQKAQRLSDKLDPNKYSKIRREDGGFDFVDPEGNKIDLQSYLKVTNQRAIDVLKDSENVVDKQYMQDAKAAEELFEAVQTNDQETIKSFYESNPELKGKPISWPFEQLKTAYPNIYGRRIDNRGQVFGSSQPNLRSAGNSLFGKYVNQFNGDDTLAALSAILTGGQ